MGELLPRDFQDAQAHGPMMTEFETKSLELLQSINARLDAIEEMIESYISREMKKESNKIDALNKTVAGFLGENKK